MRRTGSDGCADELAVAAHFANRLHVRQIQILAPRVFHPVFKRFDDRLHAADGDNIGSESENAIGHVIVQSGNDRHHGDHGHHANDNAQKRQQRAKPVGP